MATRSIRFLTLACVLVAATAATAATGAPASPETARAQALFDEAKTLAKAGRWSDACPKLEESQRVEPRMTTLYRLAECYEHVGRPASAWKAYTEAADVAGSAKDPAKRGAALERAAALEPQVSWLTVSLDAADAAASVTLDGAALPAAQLGKPLALDPGDHAIDVTAPGRKPFHKVVTFTAIGARQPLVVPALDEARARPPSTLRIVGLAVAGVGVVGLGVGGFLGFSARSRYHEADAHCVGGHCDAWGAARTQDARSLGNVATVIFSVGAAAAVGGVVLFLTAPKSNGRDGAATSTSIGVGPGAVTLRMTF